MQRKFVSKIEKADAIAGKPGWFFLENDKKQREVYISVPPIEGFGRLINHDIDVNGGVSPSVRVTGTDKDGKPAEYHEFIILTNWPTGTPKPSKVQFI